MAVLNLEQTLFDLWIPILPFLASLFSFLDTITQQGTECVKSGPSQRQHKRAGPCNPQRPYQMNDLHSMQIVHMRKSESVLQLAFNLYFRRQLERDIKVNTGKISITDIHHSEFIWDISKTIYVHVNVHMVFFLLISQSS